MKAASKVTFMGTRNGVITPVAIIFAPGGSELIMGLARKSLIAAVPGQIKNNTPNTMRTAADALISRLRSSIRCEMKVSCSPDCCSSTDIKTSEWVKLEYAACICARFTCIALAAAQTEHPACDTVILTKRRLAHLALTNRILRQILLRHGERYWKKCAALRLPPGWYFATRAAPDKTRDLRPDWRLYQEGIAEVRASFFLRKSFALIAT